MKFNEGYYHCPEAEAAILSGSVTLEFTLLTQPCNNVESSTCDIIKDFLKDFSTVSIGAGCCFSYL